PSAATRRTGSSSTCRTIAASPRGWSTASPRPAFAPSCSRSTSRATGRAPGAAPPAFGPAVPPAAQPVYGASPRAARAPLEAGPDIRAVNLPGQPVAAHGYGAAHSGSVTHPATFDDL